MERPLSQISKEDIYSRAIVLMLDNISENVFEPYKSIDLIYSEGKLLLLSIIFSIIKESKYNRSNLLIDKIVEVFLASLTIKEKSKINVHSSSFKKFISDRIDFYTDELDLVESTKGFLPMGSAYCLFIDPLGKIEFTILENGAKGFSEPYVYNEFKIMLDLIQRYVAIYTPLHKQINEFLDKITNS